MTVFVGVDGGGTRTRAVVVDAAGAELARAEADGAVVTAQAPQQAADAVALAVTRAADAAGASLPAEGLWAGLAGAGPRPARTAVTRALEARGLAARVVVGTDVEAAFHDAFASGPGILLIAGTGSVVWARDAEGTEHRVGGWGHLLGDEGSGYFMGLEALRAVARSADGRTPPTALAGEVMGRFGLDSVHDLVGWTGEASKRDIAALAPVVARVAEEMDEAAAAIVQAAVDALRTHLEAALVAVGAAAHVEGAPEVVLWGGLVAPGGPLAERVRDTLTAMGVEPVDRPVDPALGAARLARAGGS